MAAAAARLGQLHPAVGGGSWNAVADGGDSVLCSEARLVGAVRRAAALEAVNV